jgi:aminopeptidase
MVGSAQLNIDGELPDGTIEPLFRQGNWVNLKLEDK